MPENIKVIDKYQRLLFISFFSSYKQFQNLGLFFFFFTKENHQATYGDNLVQNNNKTEIIDLSQDEVAAVTKILTPVNV